MSAYLNNFIQIIINFKLFFLGTDVFFYMLNVHRCGMTDIGVKSIEVPVHGNNRNYIKLTIYDFIMCGNLCHIFYNLLSCFHVILTDLSYYLM